MTDQDDVARALVQRAHAEEIRPGFDVEAGVSDVLCQGGSGSLPTAISGPVTSQAVLSIGARRNPLLRPPEMPVGEHLAPVAEVESRLAGVGPGHLERDYVRQSVVDGDEVRAAVVLLEDRDGGDAPREIGTDVAGRTRPAPSTTDFAMLLEASATGNATALPCRTHDPDLWFADSPSELERAKQLCTPCPVRHACLAAALSRQEPWGVWGGEIFERGVVIARKRPRRRPRRTADGL